MPGTYPGSKMRKKEFGPDYKEQKPTEEETLGKAKTFLVNGQPKEFYAVGDLANALNRRSVTIRKWETEGVIPSATFILPSDDKRGRRRLYTEDQIKGLQKIAEEEGLLQPNANGKWRAIEETKFRQRAVELFKTLEGK